MGGPWARAAVVGAALVAGTWGINTAFSPPGWACDSRTTGLDMWPGTSGSQEAVLAMVAPPEGAEQHDPPQESGDYAVRQYLVNGDIVQEVEASRADGRWRIDSVTSC